MRDPKFAQKLTVRNEDGERPVVVVLPDDSLGYLFDRVENYGGSANVVVDFGASVMIIAVTPDPPGAVGHLGGGLHDDSPVEMLTLLLRKYGPQQCYRIRAAETRLVSEQELITA
ncbi:MAG: hypothetical protein IRZ08_22930 [Frankia sp.]|nr:hypothetical protein [Frankia sp.]